MEEVKKQKSNKGLVVSLIIFIVLFVISLGVLGYGYTKYDKLEKDYNSLHKEINNVKDYLNKAKEELDKSKNEVKALEESANKNAQYEFDLSKINCSKSNNISCAKKLDVRYNGENHSIKIESTKQKNSENEMVITYKIFDNDKLLQTIKGGSYSLEYADDLEKGNWNFDGYVYVFDSKYLSFVLPNYSFEKIGYDATFITSKGKLIKKVNVEMAWTSFGTRDKDLDSISNLKFDGHMLKVWDLNCKNIASGKAIQVGITIDNDKLVFKKLNTISGVTGGGQGGCKFQKENIQ